ncbi:hypothetical protein EAJ15_15960 [Parabacteroides merdae]|nr:hypothetical protein EAJ15_15960 [Parabacteroides merdae]
MIVPGYGSGPSSDVIICHQMSGIDIQSESKRPFFFIRCTFIDLYNREMRQMLSRRRLRT